MLTLKQVMRGLVDLVNVGRPAVNTLSGGLTVRVERPHEAEGLWRIVGERDDVEPSAIEIKNLLAALPFGWVMVERGREGFRAWVVVAQAQALGHVLSHEREAEE